MMTLRSRNISECTRNLIVLGRFVRGPDDDSKQSKHLRVHKEFDSLG